MITALWIGAGRAWWLAGDVFHNQRHGSKSARFPHSTSGAPRNIWPRNHESYVLIGVYFMAVSYFSFLRALSSRT